MAESGQAIIQTRATHNRIASGTAARSPRAKLRRGPKRGSFATERLFLADLAMPITLSIIHPTLMLPSSVIQRLGKRNGRAIEGLHLIRLIACLVRSSGERSEQAIAPVVHVSSSRTRKTKGPLSAHVAILATLCAMPRVAMAQPAVETPTDMFEPERGPGISISPGLVLYNRSRVEGRYDSNIYNVERNRTDDLLALAETDFRLTTRLSRHEAELRAGATLRRYADITDENSETYRLGSRAFLDLGERIAVRTAATYAREVELRGLAGDQFATDHPVRFNRLAVEASIERTGGILEAALSGSIQRRRFLDATVDGAELDLGHRDATVHRGQLQARYRMSPVLRVYAQIGVNGVEYRRNSGGTRDSHGYSALAGLHYEVTRLIDVEAAVGYIRQNFDMPGAEAVSGLNYQLRGTWTPTPKWRVTASGERLVDSSPLTNAPAIVRSNFDLRVQRALGDRMLAEAGISYTDEDYRGLDRHDRRYAGYGNVQYRVTEQIAAFVEAGYRKQSSKGDEGRSYSGTSVSVGLRLAL